MRRLKLRAAAVLLLFHGALWCQEPGPATHVSPDGGRSAYVRARPADDWQTIWLSENGQVRDLLPGDVSGKLGSPGIRAVKIAAWLNNRELAFLYYCGTGCAGIYRIDVGTGQVSELWTGRVDGRIHWSPKKDRAAVEGDLGELLLVSVSGSVLRLPGCSSESGQWRGQWHAFDAWVADGDRVRLRRARCEGMESPPPRGGELVLWDGGRLTH